MVMEKVKTLAEKLADTMTTADMALADASAQAEENAILRTEVSNKEGEVDAIKGQVKLSSAGNCLVTLTLKSLTLKSLTLTLTLILIFRSFECSRRLPLLTAKMTVMTTRSSQPLQLNLLLLLLLVQLRVTVLITACLPPAALIQINEEAPIQVNEETRILV